MRRPSARSIRREFCITLLSLYTLSRCRLVRIYNIFLSLFIAAKESLGHLRSRELFLSGFLPSTIPPLKRICINFGLIRSSILDGVATIVIKDIGEIYRQRLPSFCFSIHRCLPLMDLCALLVFQPSIKLISALILIPCQAFLLSLFSYHHEFYCFLRYFAVIDDLWTASMFSSSLVFFGDTCLFKISVNAIIEFRHIHRVIHTI